MQMEAIDSSLISHRGHDPERQVMTIRFRIKTGAPGSLYEYGNVSAAIYAEACAHKEMTFGQYFQRIIKPDPKRFPFRKLEEAATTDFASQQPIPVIPLESDIVVPKEPAALKQAVTALTAKTSAIGYVIRTGEDYKRLGTMVMAVVKMRKGIADVYDPEIAVKHKAHKDAIADKNFLDAPLARFEQRVDRAMADFREADARRIRAENERLRIEAEKQAEAEARQRAVNLQLEDAIEAESRGENELAETILASAPLPMAPLLVIPSRAQSAVPKVEGIAIVEGVDWEITDESLIPDAYMKRVPDEDTIEARVKSLGMRASIPGVRVFPVSGQRKRRK